MHGLGVMCSMFYTMANGKADAIYSGMECNYCRTKQMPKQTVYNIYCTVQYALYPTINDTVGAVYREHIAQVLQQVLSTAEHGAGTYSTSDSIIKHYGTYSTIQ